MTKDRERGAHWADEVAGKVAIESGMQVISTGISPSGEIHIGNLREVLTGDAVYRALKGRAPTTRFHFVCDNFDPLRRVYPFLDAAEYAPLVGRPLSDIRCPCGEHGSYSEHFLEPFLEGLQKLRVEVEVLRADRLYRSDRMTPCIIEALEHRDRIANILHELTGKAVAADWSPFNPLCPECGRIDQAKVTAFSSERRTVEFRCACGSKGELPMAGGGKLTWRVDWPARWKALGVTVEPFGKDHATRGGSYDTGVRVVREVFGSEPPFPIPYEWIRLKGGGDMSSSKGNVLSVSKVLRVVPPEVLRYLVLREKPQRTIAFDPGLPLLQLVDEVDDTARANRDARALELSLAGGFRPVGVPFKHLVVAAQAARMDVDRSLEVLSRTGYTGLQREAVAERIGYARRWLESFAPEDIRFEVQDSLPSRAKELSADQRGFLALLAERLGEDMGGEAIHALVYELANRFPNTRPAALFQAIYVALLGKTRGPRAGWFIAFLGPDFAASRFREASEERE